MAIVTKTCPHCGARVRVTAGELIKDSPRTYCRACRGWVPHSLAVSSLANLGGLVCGGYVAVEFLHLLESGLGKPVPLWAWALMPAVAIMVGLTMAMFFAGVAYLLHALLRR